MIMMMMYLVVMIQDLVAYHKIVKMKLVLHLFDIVSRITTLPMMMNVLKIVLIIYFQGFYQLVQCSLTMKLITHNQSCHIKEQLNGQ